ncbi:DUF5675 family protein [Cyclobacterium sp.]|uniref:DUF5675 family protein n=1 Tax=Cyclobacterium sp. TaxID=1966343 RepID=UPI0019C83E5D|nr:DUF5675 family protein [Cyclobacterium sp.]MBD3630528.1 hypothetical protein [Cyclobacterium sp.]
MMNKNSLSMIRDVQSPNDTRGRLFVLDENGAIVFFCFTLELPWKDNQQNISCIPEGRYKVKKRSSQKYGNHLHILDVPGRSWILIHEANFVSQLRGCIAIGKARADINGDGLEDVTESVKTKHALLELLPDETEIVIRS